MTQTQSLRERLWERWKSILEVDNDVTALDALEHIVLSERAAAWAECREAAAKLVEKFGWDGTPQRLVERIRSLEMPTP